MLYKRGNVWWYEFSFHGCRIRQSTEVTNKLQAAEIEDAHHDRLRKSSGGIVDRKRVPMFSVAAEKYLAARKSDWAPKTHVIEKTNLAHLDLHFGSGLLSDMGPDEVGEYRDSRLTAGASPKTVSLELGTLRAMLRFHDLDAVWSKIAKTITLKKAENIGRCISVQEEGALLPECRKSRSRSLHVAVTVAIESCLRYSEIRLLRWRQVDFGRRQLTVGKSKTRAGQGRVVPMSRLLLETLSAWASIFPARKLDHFVFPSEKYGEGGKVYDLDVTKPIGTWKEGWEHAKARAGVSCRFHDLRHTGCTRLLDSGVSHSIVADIMGWSASTAIRMITEVYGHIGTGAKHRAIEQREQYMLETAPQIPPQIAVDQKFSIQ
jgi:integrase